MEIARVAPYWFTPKARNPDNVRLKLKPLGEQDRPELESSWELDPDLKLVVPTTVTWYVAGSLGIIQIEGLKVDGRDAIFARDKDVIPYEWVVEAGIDLTQNWWGKKAEDIEKN